MASSELRESQGEGVPILEVPHEVGELTPLHMVLAGVEPVVDGGEGI